MRDKSTRPWASRVADADLSTELAHIRSLKTDELRSFWCKLTGLPPSRQLSGDLLRRMVMDHVQEQAVGCLDRKTAKMLGRLADGSGVAPTRLANGTVLVREHGGVMQQVMVVDGGFFWNDQVLSSLSAVAKAITGTTWNGNRFFGIRRMTVDREGGERNQSLDQPIETIGEAQP